MNGRKLVGLCQARRARAVLLSAGTLLSVPPWAMLCDALGGNRADADQLARRTISCSQALDRPMDVPRWAASLLDTLWRSVERASPG